MKIYRVKGLTPSPQGEGWGEAMQAGKIVTRFYSDNK